MDLCTFVYTISHFHIRCGPTHLTSVSEILGLEFELRTELSQTFRKMSYVLI